MKRFLEPAEASASVEILSTLAMNLNVFVFYGGPGTIAVLAKEISVIKDSDDDDDDKTCCGFGVVLAMMKRFPDHKMIQYYGCAVIFHSAMEADPQTEAFPGERLRQLGAIDAITSAASFPDEEVHHVAGVALEAFEEMFGFCCCYYCYYYYWPRQSSSSSSFDEPFTQDFECQAVPRALVFVLSFVILAIPIARTVDPVGLSSF
jgi:hypothetical protein